MKVLLYGFGVIMMITGFSLLIWEPVFLSEHLYNGIAVVLVSVAIIIFGSAILSRLQR